MLCVFTSHESNLSCNKPGFCKVREYWLLFGLKITRGGVTSFVANEFAFGPKNAQHVEILLQKVELLSAFRNKFSHPATTGIVAEYRFERG